MKNVATNRAWSYWYKGLVRYPFLLHSVGPENLGIRLLWQNVMLFWRLKKEKEETRRESRRESRPWDHFWRPTKPLQPSPNDEPLSSVHFCFTDVVRVGRRFGGKDLRVGRGNWRGVTTEEEEEVSRNRDREASGEGRSWTEVCLRREGEDGASLKWGTSGGGNGSRFRRCVGTTETGLGPDRPLYLRLRGSWNT